MEKEHLKHFSSEEVQNFRERAFEAICEGIKSADFLSEAVKAKLVSDERFVKNLYYNSYSDAVSLRNSDDNYSRERGYESESEGRLKLYMKFLKDEKGEVVGREFHILPIYPVTRALNPKFEVLSKFQKDFLGLELTDKQKQLLCLEPKHNKEAGYVRMNIVVAAEGKKVGRDGRPTKYLLVRDNVTGRILERECTYLVNRIQNEYAPFRGGKKVGISDEQKQALINGRPIRLDCKEGLEYFSGKANEKKVFKGELVVSLNPITLQLDIERFLSMAYIQARETNLAKKRSEQQTKQHSESKGKETTQNKDESTKKKKSNGIKI